MAFQGPGFCYKCETILPQVNEKGLARCYTCSNTISDKKFVAVTIKHTVLFNSRDQVKNSKVDDEDEGPIVERKCPRCGNDTMSYATVQLRSADEGQTVFFTCTKCKFKDSENS